MLYDPMSPSVSDDVVRLSSPFVAVMLTPPSG
jgi:hypothetical protein